MYILGLIEQQLKIITVCVDLDFAFLAFKLFVHVPLV